MKVLQPVRAPLRITAREGGTRRAFRAACLEQVLQPGTQKRYKRGSEPDPRRRPPDPPTPISSQETPRLSNSQHSGPPKMPRPDRERRRRTRSRRGESPPLVRLALDYQFCSLPPRLGCSSFLTRRVATEIVC